MRASKAQDGHWSLLSSEGSVVFYLAICPGSRIDQIAQGLGLTERSVRRVVRRLLAGRTISRRRHSRAYRYSVNLDAPFPVPAVRGLTLHHVLTGLLAEGLPQREEVCA